VSEACYLKWDVELPERPIKGVKYFGNLKEFVIDSGICSHCTTCANICPVRGITAGDKPIDFPNWEELCVDCGACIRVCPRWNYVPLNGMGEFKEMVAAKSRRFTGQDGGMVTEIIASALEMGVIDRAIFVGRDDEWKPTIVHVKNIEQLEVERVRGTKYSFADVIVELRDAVFHTEKGVGVIGTPCMVSGVRKLQKTVRRYHDRVKVVIGLFCTENFYHHQLYSFLEEKGVDVKKIAKTDITKGKFIATMESGDTISIPVKEFEPIVPSGCKVCQDFSGVESDVSVGSVGSPDGFSSVIVRTDVAKDIMDFIRKNDYAELGEVKQTVIQKLVDFKIKIHPYPPKKKE
jgi:coenzyme F420 hydrogenase subunit beta